MFKGDFLWVTQLDRSKVHQIELFQMSSRIVRYQPASWIFVTGDDPSPTTFYLKIIEVVKVCLLLLS